MTRWRFGTSPRDRRCAGYLGHCQCQGHDRARIACVCVMLPSSPPLLVHIAKSRFLQEPGPTRRFIKAQPSMAWRRRRLTGFTNGLPAYMSIGSASRGQPRRGLRRISPAAFPAMQVSLPGSPTPCPWEYALPSDRELRKPVSPRGDRLSSTAGPSQPEIDQAFHCLVGDADRESPST